MKPDRLCRAFSNFVRFFLLCVFAPLREVGLSARSGIRGHTLGKRVEACFWRGVLLSGTMQCYAKGPKAKTKGQKTMNATTVSWVVYLMTIHNKPTRVKGVCEQSEWDAMELARPGYHVLVRGGIASEVEAETLARDQPTDVAPSAMRGKPR
jgi:hypothetical protein